MANSSLILVSYALMLRMCRDSSVGTATRYELDGPGFESRWEARFSAPVQTYPVGHPASYVIVTGAFSGVMWPGRGAGHPPSCADVKGRVELYLNSLSEPPWSVLG